MSDENFKKGRGEAIFTPSSSPETSNKLTGATLGSSPKLPLCRFAFIFLHFFYLKQVSTISIQILPFHCGILVLYLLCSLQFCEINCLWIHDLNTWLGVVMDGPRPILDHIVDWHAILFSISRFYMLEHAPTNRSIKCLNDHCMCCEIWMVKWCWHMYNHHLECVSNLVVGSKCQEHELGIEI